MTKEKLEKEITSYDKVVVKFGAEWCAPCKAMIPILKEVNDMGVKVIDIDIEELGDLASEFGVSSIPTIIYYQNGERLDTTIGSVSKDRILANFI